MEKERGLHAKQVVRARPGLRANHGMDMRLGLRTKNGARGKLTMACARSKPYEQG